MAGLMVRNIVLAGLAGTLIAGCSRSHHHIPDAPRAQPAEFYQPASTQTAIPALMIERPPYRLGVGDVLEIIYHVRTEISEEAYRLKPGDRVRIVFPYQTQYTQEAVVSGDGSIRALLIGGVRAAGYTPGDLELQLKEHYRKYIKDPELTVLVEAGEVKIEELKRAITTSSRGQSRLVPIKPDGTVDLPYVGECPVAGRTVAEAKTLLDKRYAAADMPEVEVTVQALEFAPKRVFVMGEVYSPGMVTTQAPISLTQAIIQTGGANPRADQKSVLLVRRKYLPIPEAIIFDMAAYMDSFAGTGCSESGAPGHAFSQDIYLEDGDVIYVPATGMAKANDWIDQVFTRGIRAVLPYSGEVGLDFGYQIRNAPLPVDLR